MELPNENQVNAGLRHVYTSAATILTLATVVAIVPQESVAPILAALHQIGDGVQQVVGGFSKLSVLVGPIIAGLMIKIAGGSAGIKSQAASLMRMMNSAKPEQAAEAKSAVLTAAVNAPDIQIQGKILAPPEVANAVPSDKVVAK